MLCREQFYWGIINLLSKHCLFLMEFLKVHFYQKFCICTEQNLHHYTHLTSSGGSLSSTHQKNHSAHIQKISMNNNHHPLQVHSQIKLTSYCSTKQIVASFHVQVQMVRTTAGCKLDILTVLAVLLIKLEARSVRLLEPLLRYGFR